MTGTLPSTVRSFNIPAQPVADALIQFGQQSGLQATSDAGVVQTLRNSPVQGRMTWQQALSTLLTGTGLAYRLNGTMVTVEKLTPGADANGSMSLAPLRVEGAVPYDGGTSDPYAGMINPPTTVGSKEPLTQRQIPQSVTVISQTQIRQQGLNDLNDALRKTPGIVVTPYRDARADLFSRGFPIDTIQLDGAPINISSTASGLLSPNLVMYDRVESLRGPAGLYNGFGSPGATINLVRKRPYYDLQASAEARIGTYGERKITVDASTPLNSSKTVRARIAGSYENTDLYQNGTYKRPALFYGVVEADITPTTQLRAGGSYEVLDQHTMNLGYPAFSDYRLIANPQKFLGNDNGYAHYEAESAFINLDQKLGRDWKLQISGNILNNTSIDTGAFPSQGGVDPVTGDVKIANGYADRSHNTQYVVNAFVNGPVDVLNRRHSLTLGFNYQHVDNDLLNIYGGTTSGNFYNPIPVPAYTGPKTYNDLYTATSQYTAYANARIKILDPLTLILGGSLTLWDGGNTPDQARNPFGNVATSDQVGPKLTPYLGLVYDINGTYSVYGSYSSILTPQTARDASNNLIKPITGDQYEVGIKGTYFAGQLNTSLALYQITESNRAVADPFAPPFSGISLAQGKARSRGFETSLSGKIYKGLDVYAGYVYTDVQSLGSDTGGTFGEGAQTFTQIAPKHTFKLWVSYQFPGHWRNLTLGGGANVSSSYYYNDGVSKLTQPAYATADAYAAYKINSHITASFNITNMFNKLYYESIGSTWNQNFVGTPRTIFFTLRAQL